MFTLPWVIMSCWVAKFLSWEEESIVQKNLNEARFNYKYSGKQWCSWDMNIKVDMWVQII